MEPADGTSTACQDTSSTEDPPALVAVVNRPVDLQRAMDERWYRIPLRRAPSRLAANYLAFYQTGAFSPDERWLIKWAAPVHSYHLATRRELLPEEPMHPRADDQYFRVSLGDLFRLTRAIPSRRLRRITFIPTTLGRLQSAAEINDLWIRNSAQERLWRALQEAGLDAECQYPLHDDVPHCVADFTLFCREGRIAVVIGDNCEAVANLGDDRTALLDYVAIAADWVLIRISAAELRNDPACCTTRLLTLVRSLGGTTDP
jgi:hypothetical protein